MKEQNPILDTYFQGNPVSFVEFMNLIQEKKFALRDAGILPRVFHLWKKEGVFDYAGEAEKMARFDFIEIMWLRTLVILRSFGLSFEQLKRTKAIFDQEADFENALFMPSEAKTRELLPSLNIKQEEKEFAMLIFSPEFKEAWQKLIDLFSKFQLPEEKKEPKREEIISPLHMAIFWAILQKYEASIIVFATGEALIWSEENYMYAPEKAAFFTQPHIRIRLQSLFVDFISEEHNAKFLTPLNLLNENEMEVLSYLRKRDIKELRVKFHGKDILIETQIDGNLKEEQAKRLIELFALGKYDNVSFKTNGGKQVYFEKVQRKKL